jgi:NADP-dependent 3-hydroxy acid dehydrogenase YdfG
MSMTSIPCGRVSIDLFERLGAVDVFIANAGINGFTRVGAGDFAGDRRIIQTNVLGALACLDAAAAQFIARRAGHLVGISSLASMIAVPTQGAYCASKAATVGVSAHGAHRTRASRDTRQQRHARFRVDRNHAEHRQISVRDSCCAGRP